MRKLVWPLPALLAWVACWLVFVLGGRLGIPILVCFGVAAAVGVGCSLAGGTRWRRALIGLGFPVSLGVSGLASGLPAWSWLLPLLALALIYPIRAWRDAPLFPTPAGALDGLAEVLELPPGALVLDAGCGLGDALRELRIEYPNAHLYGLEWSGLLRLICAVRCRFATVRRADIWAQDWSPFELVYIFQRPESVPRAMQKALRDMRPGAWLVSLEFDLQGERPTRVLNCRDGRRVWLYQIPSQPR